MVTSNDVFCFGSNNNIAYPLVIAAHPYDCNQFALGMSDGSVHVIEFGDADAKSGSSATQEIGTLASSNASNLSLNSQQLETVQTMVQNMRIKGLLMMMFYPNHTISTVM
ncbi:putative Topless family protein [Helianthus anomalus]